MEETKLKKYLVGIWNAEKPGLFRLNSKTEIAEAVLIKPTLPREDAITFTRVNENGSEIIKWSWVEFDDEDDGGEHYLVAEGEDVVIEFNNDKEALTWFKLNY